MEDVPRTRNRLSEYEDPPVLRYTTSYFIKLLVERHAIRAAIENPGASIVLHGVEKTMDTSQVYSSSVMNGIHCDLLAAEQLVNSLPLQQRRALMEWVDGMPFKEEERFSAMKVDSLRKRDTQRKRKDRVLEVIAPMWAEEETDA